MAHNPADVGGGLRYTLGPLGDLIHPAPRGRRSLLAWRAELARSPKLNHLLGVNGFFTDLAGHARTQPNTRLARWWSETTTAAVYALAGIHPDGHGIWQHHTATVGFFLEHDRATESPTVVAGELAAYRKPIVAGGPRYPVLIHVPSAVREAVLHRQLTPLLGRITVATAVHGPNPAGPIWALVGAGGRRLALHELPSDHGPDGIANPHRFDQ